jgi:hypothetical protein|tara:strand:+ start:1703 stop:1804 length:102 start_codon:yes stop_codon:yes gene_type:complete
MVDRLRWLALGGKSISSRRWGGDLGIEQDDIGL